MLGLELTAEAWKKYLSEFLGTFGLVLFGTGAIVIGEASTANIDHFGVSFSFGLVVMAMIYTFGSTSGAHINPAVSVAFWMSGHLERKFLIGYIIFQLMGALAASLLLLLAFPETTNFGVTLPSIPLGAAIGVELVLTFFLMAVIIFMVTGPHDVKPFIGLVVGLYVFLAAYVGGPVTGASMNPARSFGPAVVSGDLQYLWMYFLVPAFGAVVAIFLCRFVKSDQSLKPN